ncbi:ATP-dependent zinc metalloprotease YME1L1-like [Solea senegalensis]|uniref:ATP-dependent zinc metalloprotease YME1L1-like n=1 Tax=Solea senegalensis TaxID=28829 RepID=A0AAV6T4E3_SOLSE|nr:ATP-dependent zinc metalloprotease YME1L1-like [Solea senegalensis]
MVTRFGMCEKESYKRTEALLKSHTKEHKNLAEGLLKYETLDAIEIKMVIEGKTLEKRLTTQ